MERIKRGGKDERGEPRFNPYFSASVLCGWGGFLSSLGGLRQEGGVRGGGQANSKQEAKTSTNPEFLSAL